MKVKRPGKNTLIVTVFILLAMPVFYIAMKLSGVIFTYTGSIPRGFYRIVATKPIKRGDYISFCLPKDVSKIGMTRGYLDAGSCPDGSDELIKKVIAIPGDTVTASANQIEVKNKHYDQIYMAPLIHFDENNQPVRRFIKNGSQVIAGYWVYGSGDPKYSWDSRYYGEIPKEYVTHRLVSLWQF